MLTLTRGNQWVHRTVLIASFLIIALAWVNSRIFILRRNQPDGRPVVLAGYYYYHAMAVGLEEGRVGQFDNVRLTRYFSRNDPLLPYEKRDPASPQRWLSYYTLDIGYLFIVETARLVFPSLPDTVLRALALQLLADAGLVALIVWMFSAWSRTMGVVAALLYILNAAFCFIVSIPYYYYWDVPLSFLIIGAMGRAYSDADRARSWLLLAAVSLAVGVWIRASWWPLAAFLLAAVWLTPRLRQNMLIPVCVFGVIAAPQLIRSSTARGRLTLSTRAVWHVAMVGLGYTPNPYGFVAKDESVFRMTNEKYGVEFRADDYFEHDQMAKRLFLETLRKDPRFVVTSFLRRFTDSLAGSAQTGVLSYWRVNNLWYRVIALAGCLAMIAAGGELRFLAAIAFGMYGIYVTLTSVFFFVGDLYDNVPEVALLVCVVGGIQSMINLRRQRRPSGRLPDTP